MNKNKIQSIIFKKKYWSDERAEKWLKKNKFVPIKKVHLTDNYLRFRLKPVGKGMRRIIWLKKTIGAIYEL